MILNSYTGFIKSITVIHADIRSILSWDLFKPATIPEPDTKIFLLVDMRIIVLVFKLKLF
jgi:hypothetical protein